MQAVLADIQNGAFAERFIDDQDAGAPEFKALREKGEQHPIEATGRELRKLMRLGQAARTPTTSRAPPRADPPDLTERHPGSGRGAVRGLPGRRADPGSHGRTWSAERGLSRDAPRHRTRPAVPGSDDPRRRPAPADVPVASGYARMGQPRRRDDDDRRAGRAGRARSRGAVDDLRIAAFWQAARGHVGMGKMDQRHGRDAGRRRPAAVVVVRRRRRGGRAARPGARRRRTATALAVAELTQVGARGPARGGPVDRRGRRRGPAALLRTTEVEVVPFDQVTAEHAAAEAEGDGTLDSWRAQHEASGGGCSGRRSRRRSRSCWSGSSSIYPTSGPTPAGRLTASVSVRSETPVPSGGTGSRLGAMADTTAARHIRLAVIAGDGIGPEVVARGAEGARPALHGTRSPRSRPRSTTSAPAAGTRPARRCRTPCWRSSRPRRDPARRHRRPERAERRAGARPAAASCASRWTTTSTCARPALPGRRAARWPA